MPKLRDVIEGIKIKIYCKGTIRRRCVLAALRIVKFGLTEYGKQTKSLDLIFIGPCIILIVE